MMPIDCEARKSRNCSDNTIQHTVARHGFTQRVNRAIDIQIIAFRQKVQNRKRPRVDEEGQSVV